ncbi:protein phosphatase [Streptomyces sp. NPDC088812]|uniref:protein-tyrosine phosphatase family protein n=1 Tax=Streptomyces sp. NPDC088812 TaxID=3365905 RepID=UPI0037FA4E4E
MAEEPEHADLGGRLGERAWRPGQPGVLVLPSGRLVRGRGLRRPLDPAADPPSYGLYLLGSRPPRVPWEARWVRRPDFRLPADRADARAAFAEAWRRAAGEPVEVACAGGRGRTGTALACLAVLDGVPAGEAVAFVRRHYDRHAVETPWQRAYVRRFGRAGAADVTGEAADGTAERTTGGAGGRDGAG